MAKAKKAKKSAPTSTQPKKSVEVISIGVEASEDTPNYYVNYIEVSHGPHDFCMSAARIPTKLNSQQMAKAAADEKLTVDAMMQIVIPTSIVKGLIDALQKQVAKYEENFGPLNSRAVKAGAKNGKAGT